MEGTVASPSWATGENELRVRFGGKPNIIASEPSEPRTKFTYHGRGENPAPVEFTKHEFQAILERLPESVRQVAFVDANAEGITDWYGDRSDDKFLAQIGVDHGERKVFKLRRKDDETVQFRVQKWNENNAHTSTSPPVMTMGRFQERMESIPDPVREKAFSKGQLNALLEI